MLLAAFRPSEDLLLADSSTASRRCLPPCRSPNPTLARLFFVDSVSEESRRPGHRPSVPTSPPDDDTSNARHQRWPTLLVCTIHTVRSPLHDALGFASSVPPCAFPHPRTGTPRILSCDATSTRRCMLPSLVHELSTDSVIPDGACFLTRTLRSHDGSRPACSPLPSGAFACRCECSMRVRPARRPSSVRHEVWSSQQRPRTVRNTNAFFDGSSRAHKTRGRLTTPGLRSASIALRCVVWGV